jgi:hypothetical protein
MWQLRFTFIFVFTFSAHATCMSECSDSDGGINPGVGGIVEMIVSCSAPGGPVIRSVKTYKDQCQQGFHTEYSCGGQGGMSFAQSSNFECYHCDEDACLELGPSVE